MIKKIRQKIETNSKDPEFLRTKYGAGYVFGGDAI
jgi:DNA-binding response OmpR family regulator